MRVVVLGSGSKGNATYIESETTKILIDCGLSYRQLKTRLASIDLTLDNLDGILITHEHTDHIIGLNVTMNYTNNPVYLTKETYDSFYYKHSENITEDRLAFIEPMQSFQIGDIDIFPISISHDASDAVGYILSIENKKLVYVTDIGYLPQKDYDYFRNADIYIFESNYDVTMLFTSNRPFYLKQRIDSVKGHMSNNDSAYHLAQLIGVNTKHIILAHPSRECNTKEAALETYYEVFNEYGIDTTEITIEVATQDVPTNIYKL